MKKIHSLLAVALLFPFLASAQLNVPQGGTGTTTFPTNWFVIGSSALRLTATGTPFFQNFTFGSATGTQATTTNFFSTKGNFSTLCILGDCKTAWPSGGSAAWGSITGTLSSQTDLQTFLNGLVPYTGATGDVNLGSNALSVSAINDQSANQKIDVNNSVLNSGGAPVIDWLNKLMYGNDGNAIVDFSGGFRIKDHTTAFAALFDTSLLTSERTFTFPDKAGTFALLSDISGTTASSTLLSDNNHFSGNNVIDFFTSTRSTTTSATTTNIFSGTASSTNLFSTNFNFGVGSFGLATGTSATTTNLFSTTASSSNLFAAKISGAGLSSCSGGTNALTWNSSTFLFGCNSISNGTSNANSKFATTTSTVNPNAVSPNGGNSTLVGIGTSTPSYQLQVASSSGVQIGLSDASLTSNHWALRTAGGSLYLATSSPSTFATSSNSVLSFTAGATSTVGYIGVGTTSPFAAFTVATGAIVNSENKPATSTAMTIDGRSSNETLVQLGTSATTLTLTGLINGQTLRVVTCSPGASAGAITWASLPANSILWPSGTVPIQTTAANKCDIYSFVATQATSTTASTVLLGAQVASY